MVGFEVGVKVPMSSVVCRGDSECRSSDVRLVLGEVYEVVAKPSGGLSLSAEDLAPRVYEAISAVRKQYPGVSINYVGISDDGTTVIQIFDPYVGELIAWEVIAILVLILGILLTVSFIITQVSKMTGGEPMTSPKNPMFWLLIGTSVALATGGIGYLVHSIKH